MNFFLIISYLNKISLLAFFITFSFLIYQLYLFRKNLTNEEKKPEIPEFQEDINIEAVNYTKLPEYLFKPQSFKKDDNKLFLIIFSFLGSLTLLLFFFISFKLNSNFNSISNLSTTKISPTIFKKQEPIISEKPELTIFPTFSIELEKISSEQLITPTNQPTPTELILAMSSPTEKITEEASFFQTLTPTSTTIKTLPLTGIIDGSLLFFFTAFFLVFLSFIF